jgi:hypothetical protein
MPDNAENFAKRRVEELKERGRSDAFYTMELPKDFWY